MSPENFVYWLQGALEIHHTIHLESDQIQIIQDHLNLVLKKETPNRTSIKDEILKRFPDRAQPVSGFPPATLIQSATC